MKLENLCSHGVVAVDRSRTLQECAALMRTSHVGTLLVTEETSGGPQAAGLVTDRDLVIEAMAQGTAPAAATIGQIAMRKLVVLPAGADIDEAIETMRREGVRRLLVAAVDGRLVGVVSMDDLLDALAREMAGLAQAIRQGIRREAQATHENCVLCGERTVRLPASR